MPLISAARKSSEIGGFVLKYGYERMTGVGFMVCATAAPKNRRSSDIYSDTSWGQRPFLRPFVYERHGFCSHNRQGASDKSLPPVHIECGTFKPPTVWIIKKGSSVMVAPF